MEALTGGGAHSYSIFHSCNAATAANGSKKMPLCTGFFFFFWTLEGIAAAGGDEAAGNPDYIGSPPPPSPPFPNLY